MNWPQISDKGLNEATEALGDRDLILMQSIKVTEPSLLFYCYVVKAGKFYVFLIEVGYGVLRML